MDNSLGKRIEQIREIERLDVLEYMKMLEVTKTSYYNWRDGKNYPNAEVLLKILELFPYYRAEWLLLGEGEMKKSQLHIVNDVEVKYGKQEGISKGDLKRLFKKFLDDIEEL